MGAPQAGESRSSEIHVSIPNIFPKFRNNLCKILTKFQVLTPSINEVSVSPYLKTHTGKTGDVRLFNMDFRWDAERARERSIFLILSHMVLVKPKQSWVPKLSAPGSPRASKSHGDLSIYLYIYLKTGLNLLRSAAHQTKSACGATSSSRARHGGAAGRGIEIFGNPRQHSEYFSEI